ncbi:hypothetical protein ACWCY1_33725 [Streptomyces goshikiensis]
MKLTLRALAATALACASLSLAGPAHADDIVPRAADGQEVLPTDDCKPPLSSPEQNGGKETHFGTNKACFSLSGGNLQLSPDALKARCLSKDISGENKGSPEDKGSPEEEKKPLKEEKCPPLALASTAGGALGQDGEE